jgi:hypothetical protein
MYKLRIVELGGHLLALSKKDLEVKTKKRRRAMS